MGSTSSTANMLTKLLFYLSLTLVSVSADKWPALKTTFSINPFGGFNSQPRTASEAEAAGWLLISACDEKFLGHRYANPADFSIVLIFDDAGYIAGIQSVLLLSLNNDPSLTTNPAYQLDWWYGHQEAYFTTAYFVDPTIICGGGRSSDEWESQGTGDRLMVQVGETPDSLLNIPISQEAADMEPEWHGHYCFLGMGDHFIQYNYQPDQDCTSVLPLQILFSEGVINGFVWQHYANLPGDQWEHPDAMAISMIIDRPPSCILELVNIPGLSTMHHYFYEYPWLTLCPLKYQRNLGGYKKLMSQTE